METQEEVFAAWAPETSIWSAWAKPTLFTQLQQFRDREESPPPPEFLASLEPRRDRAIVVELPGERAALTGFALAGLGWQPVPLWNSTTGPDELVELRPLLRQLTPLAMRLRERPLDAAAPPAFLLDAGRDAGGFRPKPGRFDNRSIVLPHDFPSALRLRAAGITEVVVVNAAAKRIADDLAHVLLAWQEGGLAIRCLTTDGGPLVDARVPRPSRFRHAWYRCIALLGLRRANVGGFGARVPQPSSGRGGFYG